MKLDDAIDIVSSLANGVDPHSGKTFTHNSPYQHPQTIRALFTVLHSIPKKKATVQSQTLPQNTVSLSSSKSAIDYRKIFELTEKTLIEYGSKNRSKLEVIENLSEFKKFANTDLTDEDYYEKIVFVIFYSGFRAATVTAKRSVIRGHFPSINRVADYSNNDIERILSDSNMIRHKKKIESCVNNAKIFKNIVQKYGSIENYINSFSPRESFDNILNLRNDLLGKFEFIGPTTIYHFLMDIGLQVIKPDRVLCRIFHRLGLIKSENNLLECVLQGREFAKHSNVPIRYVDIIFVAYGQERSIEFGIEKGICLKNPRCEHCGITEYCNFKQ